MALVVQRGCLVAVLSLAGVVLRVQCVRWMVWNGECLSWLVVLQVWSWEPRCPMSGPAQEEKAEQVQQSADSVLWVVWPRVVA